MQIHYRTAKEKILFPDIYCFYIKQSYDKLVAFFFKYNFSSRQRLALTKRYDLF